MRDIAVAALFIAWMVVTSLPGCRSGASKTMGTQIPDFISAQAAESVPLRATQERTGLKQAVMRLVEDKKAVLMVIEEFNTSEIDPERCRGNCPDLIIRV